LKTLNYLLVIMGAAASLEARKPIDASDIALCRSLPVAKAELIRLRESLGYLAKDYGMDVVVYDASDVVIGENEDEDFDRCIKEISHIRRCLCLNTQQAVRKTRSRNYPVVELPLDAADDKSSGSSTGSDDDK
jgi:hypothetical protein